MKLMEIDFKGANIFDSIDLSDAKVRRNAQRAINAGIRRARTKASESMRKQVNFPASYLSGENGRLTISKFASDNDLEAVLRGRDRPTSLARFVTSSKAKKSKGATVEVDPGRRVTMGSAFLINLRNGNRGLAYRTKDGKPPKSRGAKQLARGLFLLYGPSVDQVFNETRGEISDDILDFVGREFSRLMTLDI